MIWITAQVCWIGLTVWLQPLFFGLGAVELALGLLLRRIKESIALLEKGKKLGMK